MRARSGVRDGREALASEHLDRVALQGQFQQHGLVLEEVEAVAGDAGPALEIDQIELFGQLDVIQRLEIELRQRGLAAEQFEVRLVVHADRGVGMREVGNLPVERLQLDGQRVELRLASLRLFAQQPALFLAGLAFGRVFRLADRLRDLVRLAIELFDFHLEQPAGLFELDEAVDVDLHAAVDAVLGDEVGVFDDEFAVEHDSGRWQWTSGQSAVGSRQSAVGSRQWAVGSGQSAVGSRQWAVGSGQSAVGGLLSAQWRTTFITHHSSLITHHSSLITHHSPFIIYVFASSSQSLALALMPRWKSARENFSLGLWQLSSSWPQPIKQRVGLEPLVEGGDDRNRAALAGEDGAAAEGVLDGAGGGLDVGAVQRHQHAGGAVQADDFGA